MFSWRSRFAAIGLTTSVRRIALWMAGGMSFLVLFMSAAFLVEFEQVVDGVLDVRLNHEIDHLLPSIVSHGGTLVLVDTSELAEPDLRESTGDAFFLQVFDADGQVRLESGNLRSLPSLALLAPADVKERMHLTAEVGGRQMRVGVHPLRDSSGRVAGTLQLLTGRGRLESVRRRVILGLSFGVPVLLVLSVGFSVLLARRAFRPIGHVIELGQKISAADLDRRISYESEPEDILGRLRDTLNGLFERLAAQVEMMSHFSDNAAHQLMTPLTALSSELEFLARRGLPPAEMATSIELLRNQIDTMVAIVRTLLMISRTESEDGSRSVVDVSGTLRRGLTPYPSPPLRVVSGDELFVRGQAEVLTMAIQNLVENALKYANGSEVAVTAGRDLDSVLISVSDGGPGIPDSEKERVFERFYRSESAEQTGIKGFGLGLALARAIVKSMGGTMRVVNNKPHGSVFEMRLPALELE